MRLPTKASTRFFALGLTALLASCGRFGGGDRAAVSSTADIPDAMALAGPSADYPVVVGEPYIIGGKLFTPVDTMNYDQVGYAVTDIAGGQGVTVSHRTLPMPSYVEITALDSGKTILARVERRGPMAGNGVVALSAGAKSQLEIADNAAVRIRRVNPPEFDRAKLRIGEAAAARMDTPKSLLAVLKRKLPDEGSVSLASTKPAPAAAAAVAVAPVSNELPTTPAAKSPVRVAATRPAPASTQFEKAFSTERKVVTAYPLAPMNGSARPAAAPVRNVAAAPPAARPAQTATAPATKDADGNFVIQAAAFSSRANAQKLANSIDGFVQQSGKYYRVRKGPFVSRGQAEAALAKVRAAGYKDAKVFTAG